MDSIYIAKKIFDLLIHPYQIQVLIISKDLREFFKKDHLNSIKFWDCISYDKWTLHDIVDRETKKFDLVPIFICKFSWDFNRKNECDEIFNSWRITFQALNTKGRHFLNLLDDNLKPIKPLYSKRGLWLKFFGHFNLLCARASKAIINHASIGEY